jgi:DNA-binding PucR family transcriptional regulator
VVAALRSRPDLGRALVDRHLGDVGRDEDYLHDVAGTVTAYLERDRNVDATAAALYVHPNTVRHRLKRFHERTGLRLESPFDAVAAWWLVRTWDGGG